MVEEVMMASRSGGCCDEIHCISKGGASSKKHQCLNKGQVEQVLDP